jgi:hypothetical protein
MVLVLCEMRNMNIIFQMDNTPVFSVNCSLTCSCVGKWSLKTLGIPFAYAQPVSTVMLSPHLGNRRLLATGQGSSNTMAGRLQDAPAHDADVDAADRGIINSTQPVNN